MTDPEGNFPADAVSQLESVLPTAIGVLSDPKTFFAEMPKVGGYEAPAAFALAMLIAEGVILAVLSLVYLHPGGFFFSLIAAPILGFIAIVIGAAIVLFLANALGGQATLESSFRVVAYGSSIAPILGLAQVIPYLPLVVIAYGFYLAIVAVVAVHQVEERRAWQVLGALAAAVLFLAFLVTMSTRRISSRLDDLGQRRVDQEQQR